jgi:uncharacterized protein
MSDLLPLFPLPNVVLFPNVFLPLHIFEPRYREMVADAVASDRMIGMVLLRPGWDRDYEGTPPVYPVGCSGVITHVEALADGRFNIVLRGLREYTIVRELERHPYREAAVTWRAADPTPLPSGARDAVGALVRRYLALRGKEVGEEDLLRGSVDDETFVNFLAQHLDVEPLDKQALLEAATLAERARRLADVLEFRLEELRLPPGGVPGRAH